MQYKDTDDYINEHYPDSETARALITLRRLSNEAYAKSYAKYRDTSKIIDMHTHTTYSDGDLNPAQIIGLAINKGVGTLGITDHDTIDGLMNIKNDKGIQRTILDTGIKVINGIELSAYHIGGTMHILGYDIIIENEKLKSYTKERKNFRLYKTLAFLELLKKDYGITFNHEDIIELLKNEHNYNRPALAKLIMKYEKASSVQEAFDKYLIDANEKLKEHYKNPTFNECINLIKESGGIPVLAHPKSLNLKEKEFLILLKEMINAGLMGIEVYHSTHTKEEMEYYLNVANRYNLLVSGGSDFHGKSVKPDIELGTGKNNNLNIRSLSLLQRIH